MAKENDFKHLELVLQREGKKTKLMIVIIIGFLSGSSAREMHMKSGMNCAVNVKKSWRESY